ncbi:MAG: PilZ domain-containing protein [Nitrospira sp.]|jgi:hypothetical protein|nr:PilZ domain-containing protein [Nitrospira sp. BO4]
MPDLRCPACRASKVRLAARTTLPDALLSGLTIYPFRCQLCGRRFRIFLGCRTSNPRRSFERIDVSFPVWFRHRESAFSSDAAKEGTIDNLSIRGCRIRSTAPIRIGSRLELEFQYSDSSFPVTIDEAIVRSAVDGAIGLRFTRLHRDDERRIRHIVDVWLPETLPSA